jgi:hypothetical protein
MPWGGADMHRAPDAGALDAPAPCCRVGCPEGGAHTLVVDGGAARLCGRHLEELARRWAEGLNHERRRRRGEA